MKKVVCNSLVDLKEFFLSFKHTTIHNLKNENDNTGFILTIRSVDKPYFWLIMSEIEEQYNNVKYWVSGSFSKDLNLYVLIRIVDKKIIKNESLWQDISGQSYNEIIEFANNFELLDKAKEMIENEEKTKKKRSKKQVDK